jgi:hypothetical protein
LLEVPKRPRDSLRLDRKGQIAQALAAPRDRKSSSSNS